MERIHRGEDVEVRTECRDGRVWRPRCSCPCEAPQRSCCQVAPSTLPASPAPPPRANAHMLRHGKLRPRHPLRHRDHVHHPFLVAAGRTKPGSTRKVPCRHGRCREARALEIRVHGSIHGKFQPVTASVPCAGRALRPRIPPSRAGLILVCIRAISSKTAIGSRFRNRFKSNRFIRQFCDMRHTNEVPTENVPKIKPAQET